MMEGTDSPPSPFVLSFACASSCACGRGIRTSTECNVCAGSIQIVVSTQACLSFRRGKCLSLHAAELLHRWGARIVTTSGATEASTQHRRGAALNYIRLNIVKMHSVPMVWNPFIHGRSEHLHSAFEELLLHILHPTRYEGIDYESLLSDYPSLVESSRRGQLATAEVVMLLRVIADGHSVKVSEKAAGALRLRGVHAWFVYHAHLLRAGRSLWLVGRRASVAGLRHLDLLASALTWLACYMPVLLAQELSP